MGVYSMGLDIGYSNVKARFGTEDQHQDLILPAGVTRAQNMQTGGVHGDASDVIRVTVGNENYVAGFEPGRARVIRELHDRYTETPAYKALFYAALACTQKDEIDRLVTGLPVELYKNEAVRSRLTDMMTGEHKIAPSRSIEVKSVRVMPQPSGAYIHTIGTLDSKPEVLEAIQGGKALVIDPGFFSVDWVVLTQGEIRYDSSDSSTLAMSEIIRLVADSIHVDYSVRPAEEDIEAAIRSGKDVIMHAAKRLELKPYLEKASADVAPEVLTRVRSAMRHLGGNVDVVILAGGGGSFYLDAAKDIYQHSTVVSPKEPVMSIARGFFDCCF